MKTKISSSLKTHYTKTFATNGPNSKGVDWGSDEKKLNLRYKKMLNLLDFSTQKKPALLDVGCGYGGLLQYALSNKKALRYTGIDVADNMVKWAASNLTQGRFILGDIMSFEFKNSFDFIVCNGILTQKLDTPALEMDKFAGQLIRKMFSLARQGIAFNLMTTKVNFFKNNLYYRNPAELLSWCLTEITPYIKIDHSYPLYEYTIYLYRTPI